MVGLLVLVPWWRRCCCCCCCCLLPHHEPFMAVKPKKLGTHDFGVLAATYDEKLSVAVVYYQNAT